MPALPISTSAAEVEARGLALDRYIETIVVARTIASGLEPALDEAQLSRDLQQGLREIAERNTLPARQVFAGCPTSRF